VSLRDLNENTAETIFEFLAAAEDRYWDAISLMTDGRLAGGIYLIGYVAEMLLKGAYFALCGETLTSNVGPLLAPAWTAGVIYFPSSFSLSYRDYHNLDFWARLVREERRRRGVSLPTNLDFEYLSHTRNLYMIWWIEMRYRHAQASPQDAEDALEAVSWLRTHYIRLPTP
jgi:hypothetical protein